MLPETGKEKEETDFENKKESCWAQLAMQSATCQVAADWRSPGERDAVFSLDNPFSTQQQQGGQQ